jgi:phage tail P2-like protein
MSVDLKSSNLIDNTPPSISGDAKVQAACYAWDRQMREVIDAIDEVVILPNLAKIVDSRLIDLLAWQLHVDFYESDAPLEVRRELVQKSLEWHTYKGTKWAVQDILRTVFATGEVIEWFEYNPKPHADWHEAYRFKIVVSSGFGDPAQARRLINAINAVKPASRWLEEFVVGNPTKLDLWHASVTVRNIQTKIFMMLTPTEATGPVYVGLSLCIYKIITISAPSE